MVSNTGSPQGCVLSPLLFILYTDSYRSHKEGNYLVKSSNDTALLTLLQGSESDRGSALPDFIDWCDENFLDLNRLKTKELVVDFQKNCVKPKASLIRGKDVEIVESYQYLRTVFDTQLKFDINTECIVKRSQQRIDLLRKLNSVNVCKRILCIF